MKCPECQTEIGKGSGIDTYKHAVACLSLPDVGPHQLLKQHEGLKTERAGRVTRLMQTAIKEVG